MSFFHLFMSVLFVMASDFMSQEAATRSIVFGKKENNVILEIEYKYILIREYMH